MLNSDSVEHDPTFWSSLIAKLPVVAGVYASASGGLALVGWTFDIHRFIDWNNSGITMKANTAVCVILLGTALALATRAGKFRLLIMALAGGALAITLLTLSQYIFGINLGIDTILFDELPGSPATAAPGRMGLPAITSFTLLATALFLLTGSASMRRAAGWFGIAALSLSALPLLGYLYGASQLYSLTRVTGIAFQTATIIAVLAIGVVAAAREFGLVALIEGSTAGAVMFRRLALPLVISALIVGWLRVIGQDLGLYDTAFGTAARTLLEILIVLGLLWWTARGISRAEETLREADKRKDEFIATLSHELRNPLAPIRNAVQILRQSNSDSPDTAASRDMIERQVAHMARLIDDLLDVGRITQNKIDLQKESVEIQVAVTQATETYRSLLEERRHRLNVDLPAAPVFVHADPVRLTQILGNLLNNACKFTKPGGEIWIEVAAGVTEVTVTVRDSGVGIPTERIDSVFGLFTQVDSTGDVDHSGLGIGLNLTKHLVELHGGSIEARSDGEGRGSTFVVVLPRLSRVVAPMQAKEVSSNGNRAKPQRILIVDDNEDSLESLRLMMKIAGNETATASDGREAVKQADVFRPEIVLLDIGLPEFDGYEVCRRIRSESWGKEIFIVALTGWGQDEDRRRSAEAGFDAHLVKPVDPAVLLEVVGKNRATGG